MNNSHSTIAHLRFSAEIVRRLGEELNPTLSKVIIELAKNSYDADATTCQIQLRNVGQPGGEIVVEDNGDGMTQEQIVNDWLVLGRSSKKSTARTRLGRIPAGSKGLGRLAALRMGRTALLSTASSKRPDSGHQLLIDWDKFDESDTVEDFALTIDTMPGNPSVPQGTRIEISDLRAAFSPIEVKRLARELILLSDPFEDDPHGFYPRLIAPEFEALEQLVAKKYLDDAEFHLSAEIDESGEASASVFDWRGKRLFVAAHKDLAPSKRDQYQCPPARFDLWVFILKSEKFQLRKTTLGEVRNWLRNFGGVHVYCNNIRVSPYGGPDDDWTGMNLQRVRSPEERPSTNTSIGRLVLQDLEHQLVQKTDRSGFIEGTAFRDLRFFTRDAMNWMAKKRLAEAERRRSAARQKAPKNTDQARTNLIEELAKVGEGTRGGVEKAFKKYESNRDKEVDALKKEVLLYRTLSTAGITAATFAHESHANPIKVIWHSIATVERRAREYLGKVFKNKFSKPIGRAKRALKSLAVLGRVTLQLLDHDKRRNARLDLHKILDGVLDTFEPFLQGRDVKVVKKFSSGAPYLHGQEAALESIIANLLNNSIVAFEEAASECRIIEISTQISDNNWCLSVHDSGPGIVGIRESDIWLPGQTTRKHGTGLGLTIVRDAAEDLGGTVDAAKTGPRGGATITVYLPILGQ